jgi:hypothetical protein
MPSEILVRSGLLGRGDAAVRNLVVAASAALGGVVIGGLSVLVVVLAVTQPPSQDAPAGSAVFDGPHVMNRASAQPAAPLVQQSAQALPATPVPDQALSPADILRKTWPASDASAQTRPDALSARTRGAPDSPAVTTDQTPGTPAVTVNAQGTAIGGNDSKNDSGPDAANAAHDRRAGHLAASRNPAPLSLAPNAYQNSRRVVTLPANDQQARYAADGEASPQGQRPLFDFFGRPGHSIEDGNNQFARQRVIDQNQQSGTPPAQYDTQHDNWGSFFGRDNWTDDQRN